MDVLQAIQSRHSVRAYDDRAVEGEEAAELARLTERFNQESGLHMQLIFNEPHAFHGPMAHYGKFLNVKNYLALVGPKGRDLHEKCGYYGEKVVLSAQALGLNSCWAAMSYNKAKARYDLKKGEKLVLVIALGYGITQGAPHPSKPKEDVMDAGPEAPEWFTKGVEAALLAPTAMNQQKFVFSYRNGAVSAKPGIGFYTRVDLGIAKCHFEAGAKACAMSGFHGWAD